MSDTRVYGLSSTATSVRLLVVDLAHGRNGDDKPPVVHLDAAGQRLDLSGKWHRSATDKGETTLWWCKPVVRDLAAGTPYAVAVIDRDGVAVATARAWTLPDSGSTRFRLIAGSCYDGGASSRDLLRSAYDMLEKHSSDVARFNVWAGDQVYVDAPWTAGTRARNARRVVIDRYLRSWGLSVPSALGDAMSRTSNWYLPDDHEFWNGYPDPSWLTLFGHTLKRSIRQILRLLPKASGSPHPFAQGEWGAAAGDAYCVFQSEAEFDEFSEAISPPQLQRLETDRVLVVLVDTRWHRTIRKVLMGAGFMRDEDLDQLLEILNTEDRVVCLVVSKPVVGYLPFRGATKGGKFDVGPEYFSRQYTKLWKALSDRRSLDRPTLVVAGDVHRHSVRRALDDGLLEVVSSPLAELEDLGPNSSVTRVRTFLKSVRNLVRRVEVKLRPTLQSGIPYGYPRFVGDDDWQPASGNEVMATDEHISGLAGIEFDVEDRVHPHVTVRSVRQQAPSATECVMTTVEFVWAGRWELVDPGA